MSDQHGRPIALIEKDRPQSNTGEYSIEAILDSWRIDDEWWRNAISRRYLDIMLASGKHLVLFQDLLSGDWFLQQP